MSSHHHNSASRPLRVRDGHSRLIPVAIPSDQAAAQPNDPSQHEIHTAATRSGDRCRSPPPAPYGQSDRLLGMGTPRRHCCVGTSRPSVGESFAEIWQLESQGAQRCLADDHGPDVDGEHDDDRSADVGQDLADEGSPPTPGTSPTIYNGRKPNHSRTRDESKSRLNRPRPGN